MQSQRPDAVLALPLDYQFGTMILLTVNLQTDRILEYADSTMHAHQQNTDAFGHVGISIDNAQLHYEL